MAHYAFIDEKNKVVEVIVGVDETELIDGTSPEEWYGNFKKLKCVRTSYNSKIRGNYAGIGYDYWEDKDVFMPPKCHPLATVIEPLWKWNCTDPSHEDSFNAVAE